ncbi:2-octaprenyl-6-methoxyphenyl hydroxylase [Aliagarivorans marinus]|uniref:2-octaprenyl-6-methoxyphenyl hydroxylase n=1 Tax=Aliagarivorans marinus TaxID=561965 RepID=UPI000421C490|nr:2-octaprenyl-6-methoxyphenyl hydroxylase [Aliagarivorans marinus]
MTGQQFDLVIVGGGMVGASLALGLAHYAPKLKLALIEAQPLDFGQHPGFDGRAIALSAGSVNWLKQAQLWDELASFAAPISHIQVSDRGHLGRVDMLPDDYLLDSLGQVIELEHAGRILHQRLSQCPQVTLFCPNAIRSFERTDDSVELELEGGESLSASLLVGADGGNSQVRGWADLTQHHHDFGKVALIANIEGEQAPNGRAFERFTEDGPLALLPMTGQRWSLVWSLSPEQADYYQQCPEHEFLSALQAQVGEQAGAMLRVGQRHCYPLLLRYSPRLFSHRMLVMGNAAHTLHPIAGQGFNLGLRDVAALCKLLADSEQDPGSFALLHAYQQGREQDIQRTVLMTSLLASGFASKDKLSIVARNIGLVAMQHLDCLKVPLVRQSLGLFEPLA